MSLTSRDIESSQMKAAAKVTQYFARKNAEFNAPKLEDEVRRALLEQMTPEGMELLMREDPDSYEQMLKFIGGM